jgi:subtilisin family serine protease
MKSKKQSILSLLLQSSLLLSCPQMVLADVDINWQNKSPALDGGIQGARVDEAYELYGEGKEDIVVAIIDSGVNIFHRELTGKLWVNEGEKNPNDGIDDDGNGYIDDVYGWNYLGSASNMATFKAGSETAELTTLMRGKGSQFYTETTVALATQDPFLLVSNGDFTRNEVKGEILKDNMELTRELARVEKLIAEKKEAGKRVKRKLQKYHDQIKAQYMKVLSVFKNRGYYYSYKHYFDKSINSMQIINPQSEDAKKADTMYGNNDVFVGNRGNSHGTMVAGIIGAKRDVGEIDGVATKVKFMILRTVPDGDEHDQSVANAIRYAADNGARVANLSFGKSASMNGNIRKRSANGKKIVDSAIRYAKKKGMLVVLAAGNDSMEVTKTNTYPNKKKKGRLGKHKNLIVVGASGRTMENLVTPFTNYSPTMVDLFAPGEHIHSTTEGVPGDITQSQGAADGTSFAAPVVTGAVAYLWSHFPYLNYKQVKKAILDVRVIEDDEAPTTMDYAGEVVKLPLFSDMSKTAGVIDLMQAMDRATGFRKVRRRSSEKRLERQARKKANKEKRELERAERKANKKSKRNNDEAQEDEAS